ncbi:MAG: penicillin-binding protein 2 [Burkholderiaceae bacterium]
MKRTRVGAQFAVDKQVLKLRLSTLRLRVVLVLIGLGFTVLGARAMQLQMFKTDDLQEFGERSYTQSIHLPASRGKILDRNGLVLASSLPARAIYVDPRRFAEASPQQVVALAKALDMTPDQVRQRVEKGGRQFAYLKRQADVAEAQVVQELKVPGVETLKEYKRHYPEGRISAHVVGFTDYDDRGKEGIELASEDRLHGVDGSRRVMRDRLGRVIGDIQTVRDPVDGQDEWLSLDSHLQYLTFNALQEAVKEYGAKAGSAVVLDVNSGEILAVANWPTYDPNDRSKVRFSDMRNRTVTDSFEPGSTMKPFTAALALELRKVTPNTIIETAPGRLKIGPDTIGDSHFLGTLTVEQVVQKSSNVGTAKIALEMEARQMWEFLSAVGFGHTPEIVFPGAVAGRLRPTASGARSSRQRSPMATASRYRCCNWPRPT